MDLFSEYKHREHFVSHGLHISYSSSWKKIYKL